MGIEYVPRDLLEAGISALRILVREIKKQPPNESLLAQCGPAEEALERIDAAALGAPFSLPETFILLRARPPHDSLDTLARRVRTRSRWGYNDFNAHPLARVLPFVNNHLLHGDAYAFVCFDSDATQAPRDPTHRRGYRMTTPYALCVDAAYLVEMPIDLVQYDIAAGPYRESCAWHEYYARAGSVFCLRKRWKSYIHEMEYEEPRVRKNRRIVTAQIVLKLTPPFAITYRNRPGDG